MPVHLFWSAKLVLLSKVHSMRKLAPGPDGLVRCEVYEIIDTPNEWNKKCRNLLVIKMFKDDLKVSGERSHQIEDWVRFSTTLKLPHLEVIEVKTDLEISRFKI